MEDVREQSKVILFGPFEANLRSQELKKGSVRLRLPGQPFQILKMLLEHPGELVRYDIKTGRLQPFLSGISADHLDFSRDGKWVTYVSFPDGTLWRSRVDGSEQLQLTMSPLEVALPRLSPDGTRIAFTGSLPGERWKIHVVSSLGGKADVVSEGPYDEVDATWTPDGDSLIFGGGLPVHKFPLSTCERVASRCCREHKVYFPRASLRTVDSSLPRIRREIASCCYSTGKLFNGRICSMGKTAALDGLDGPVITDMYTSPCRWEKRRGCRFIALA